MCDSLSLLIAPYGASGIVTDGIVRRLAIYIVRFTGLSRHPVHGPLSYHRLIRGNRGGYAPLVWYGSTHVLGMPASRGQFDNRSWNRRGRWGEHVGELYRGRLCPRVLHQYPGLKVPIITTTGRPLRQIPGPARSGNTDRGVSTLYLISHFYGKRSLRSK